MRRRSPTSSPVDHMEKGTGKNQQSRLCLLASLSAFFWFLLLYFHFVVLGGSTVSDLAQLNSISVISEPLNTQSVSASLRNPQSTPISHPNNAQPTPVTRPSNAQSSPISHPSNAQPSFISHSSNAQPTPVTHPATTTQPKSQNFPFMRALRTKENKSDPCGGRYIYICLRSVGV
ncbi:hypothetical protein CsSME_00041624 [Camellia sinensis var. sinensis]